MSNNLPLILLLDLDFHHADHAPKLHEPEAPKRLGEDVSELPPGLDELDDDLSSVDAVSKEVELHVDMLASVMEDWILRQRDRRLVIHLQRRRPCLNTGEL